jgi:TetR/AcrR family transcriptional repressor of mexJK operon
MGRTARITREDVLAAAREAFVERGYEGTTLAAIGALLQVSPAAILRHAPTKEALFVAAMGQTEPIKTPLEFLDEVDGSQDPRRVLRRAAEALVPFLEARLRESVARWVYFRRVPGIGRMPLPFDPATRPTPPQETLRCLEDYMRRAVRRGRLRISNPRAGAMAFLATIHSYIFLQQVLGVPEKPMPLSEYLDAVLEIWTRGAILTRRKDR